MQSAYTGHIVPAEWRWVVIVSILLILAAFSPFVWSAAANTAETGWQFMGTLHQYRDGAAYLSKIEQGMQGNWLSHFQHTPEPHSNAIIHIVYLALGNIARLASLSPVIMFHVARVVAALFMYIALYQLAANIWMKVRTRRLFFVIVSLFSGLGWLAATLSGSAYYPDLSAAYAFPFHATIVNVHFPLTIGCLAISSGIIIGVLRPGVNNLPGVNNGGVPVFLLSLALILLYPESLLPLGAGFLVCLLATWFLRRAITLREIQWGLWIVVPALPIAAYYLITLQNNPVVAEWARQKADPTPSILALLVAFGPTLLIAAPGLIRAVRRFEPDGDRFMLSWLAAMIVLMEIPLPLQQSVIVGIMIPLAYFATRSLEDFWFTHIKRPWRYRIFVASTPFLALSNGYVLFIAVMPLLGGRPAEAGAMILEPDYRPAFEWLEGEIGDTEIVLASPDVSLWIPAWTGARVVTGHPDETLDAPAKTRAVLSWYRAENFDDCQGLLAGKFTMTQSYIVSYVVYGPREKRIGSGECLQFLQFAATFGEVDIYRTRFIRSIR